MMNNITIYTLIIYLFLNDLEAHWIWKVIVLICGALLWITRFANETRNKQIREALDKLGKNEGNNTK